MKTLLGCWYLMGFVWTPQAKSRETEWKIQILVYNYAGLPSETLANAERQAARIYARASITTEWLDCPLTEHEADRYPACLLPVSPTRLALRIFSGRMAKQFGLGGDAFGSALLPEDGRFGTIAQVCSDCAETLDAREPTPASILGHVIAHEIGHLLLGVNSHSDRGLMRFGWGRKELERAAQGLLLFTPWQSARVRRQVSARRRVELAAAKHE